MRNSRTQRAEALLRSRRRLEEVARHEFVAAGEEAQRLRERLDSLRESQRQADAEARDRLLSGERAQTGDYGRQSARLTSAAETTAAHLTEAERLVEQCRERLQQAVSGRRAAELMRDRHAAAGAAALDRRLARGREEAYAARLAIGRVGEDYDTEETP